MYYRWCTLSPCQLNTKPNCYALRCIIDCNQPKLFAPNCLRTYRDYVDNSSAIVLRLAHAHAICGGTDRQASLKGGHQESACCWMLTQFSKKTGLPLALIDDSVGI